MSILKRLGKLIAAPIRASSNLAGKVPVIGKVLKGPSANLASALEGKQPLLPGVFKAGAGAAAIGLGGAGVVGAGPLGGTLGGIGAGPLTGLRNFITANPERAARLGLGAIGAVQASQAAARQRQLENEALQHGAVFGGPTGAYGDIGNPYAGVGADSGNPYDPRYRKRGQVALREELMR